MADTGAARRAAGQRRLRGATAVVAAAGLTGTGLVVAAAARPATPAATGGVAQQTSVRSDDGFSDDGQSFGVVPQLPSSTFQPPVASSHGS